MPRPERCYWVYIMTNTAGRTGTLYTGVTNDLERRVWEHREQRTNGFTARYNLTCLVYCEEFRYVLDALSREKQIKGWRRARKIALIESDNPEWHDLSAGWFA
jgi:putative endonuclease